MENTEPHQPDVPTNQNENDTSTGLKLLTQDPSTPVDGATDQDQSASTEQPNLSQPTAPETTQLPSTPVPSGDNKKLKQIQIPDSKDKIFDVLQQNPEHPGLLAAYTSICNNHHPFGATILILGVTGTGKSSIINTLFGGEIANTGNRSLVSKTNIEYQIEVPMDDIGVSNSTLTVVDTPGFGESERESFEAQILASLGKYLVNEHRHALTCIIITVRFDDMRFSGENAPFVKMLKAFKSLKSQHPILLDTPVVFVLTCYMNAQKKDRLNPADRIEKFASIIRDYTNMADPKIIVAENEAEDRGLNKNENGFYKLPNGEHFPHNIFKGIQEVIVQTDPMGEAIVRSAYKDINRFPTPKEKEHHLVEKTDKLVLRFQKELDIEKAEVEPTEVNQSFAKFWKEFGTNDEKDTKVLKDVQRRLQEKNIFNVKNAPNTKLEIIQLMQNLPQNQFIVPAIQRTLSIIVPKLKMATEPGSCFNVFNGDWTGATIFDETIGPILTPCGFLVPSYLHCSVSEVSEDHCAISDSHKKYMKERLGNMGLSTKSLSPKQNRISWKWSESPKDVGYNIDFGPHNPVISSARLYGVCHLRLRPEKEQNVLDFLAPQFKSDVIALPQHFTSDTSDQFSSFFNKYGTHVMTSCNGGGIVHVKTKVIELDILHTKKSILLVEYNHALNQMFSKQSNTDLDPLEGFSKLGESGKLEISLMLLGGSSFNDKEISPGQRYEGLVKNLGDWKASLVESPVLLPTKQTFKSVIYFIDKFDEKRGTAMAKAAHELYGINLEYKMLQSEAEKSLVISPQPRHLEPSPSSNKYDLQTMLTKAFNGMSKIAKCNIL